jgi:stage II sporulation protein AA (anti-sigma F factor antagonist)
MARTQLEVEVRQTNGRAWLALNGEVDAYTRATLSEKLDAAVAESRGDVTLDLSGVSFVDSSGIAVLVGAAKQLRERGNDLVLVSPPAMVKKVLEMTGVNRLVRLRRSAS